MDGFSHDVTCLLETLSSDLLAFWLKLDYLKTCEAGKLNACCRRGLAADEV